MYTDKIDSLHKNFEQFECQMATNSQRVEEIFDRRIEILTQRHNA